jgi:hypothetical protein
MIPKNAIEEAIEGGWCKNYGNGKNAFYFHCGVNWVRVKVTGPDDIARQFTYAEVALDPTFWQALGKSLGWKKERGRNTDNAWIFYARDFYDLILQGKDTAEFWKELLPTL